MTKKQIKTALHHKCRSVGGAFMGLFTAAFAYDSGPHPIRAFIIFLVIFLTVSVLWSLFCLTA